MAQRCASGGDRPAAVPDADLVEHVEQAQLRTTFVSKSLSFGSTKSMQTAAGALGWVLHSGSQ